MKIIIIIIITLMPIKIIIIIIITPITIRRIVMKREREMRALGMEGWREGEVEGWGERGVEGWKE